MVDPEEYEHARQLLAEAIEEAYQGAYLIPPMELAPGYWALWPTRSVTLDLEETRVWSYGKPGGGTGTLQANIEWSYGNHERIKPRKSNVPFGKKEAERAAKLAKSISDGRAKHYGDDRLEAQEAYIAGYQAVEEAPEEDIKTLWSAREPIYRGHGNWDRLHRAVAEFLKLPVRKAGILDWLPGEAVEGRVERWGSLEKVLGHGALYDRAMRGVFDALDDWAIENGLKILKRD